MSSERREQERFSINMDAKIAYRHAEDQSEVIDTVAANISSGGAFLTTSHPFPLATKVQVEFYLSTDELKKLKFILSVDSLKQLKENHLWVTAKGIVIRQEENGVGVIFDTDYQFTPMTSSEG
jgi:c-di-GMP-binding flagellar brake protein YcgR